MPAYIWPRIQSEKGKNVRKFLSTMIMLVAALSVAGCVTGKGKGKGPIGKGKAPIVHTRG